MRADSSLRIALLVLAGSLATSGASGQVPVHDDIFRVLVTADDTPDGQGLLPTAIAEAEIAEEHALLATEDSTNLTNLEAIRRHAGHMLNAIDPTLNPYGPGLGYGAKEAIQGVLYYVEDIARADSVSYNVAMHAPHALSAARSVARRADDIVFLLQDIQLAPTGERAAQLMARLVTECHALIYGVDVDGDGLVGWQGSEAGLRQVKYHMTLMSRGEGLIN